MKRAALSILAATSLASGAAALTPIPYCADSTVLGSYHSNYAQDAGNGFVMYEGQAKDKKSGVAVVELCRSGRALVAATQLGTDATAADHARNVRTMMNDYVFGDAAYTMRQMMRGLKSQGIAAKIARLGRESCGCHQYYPDSRGDRTPYQ